MSSAHESNKGGSRPGGDEDLHGGKLCRRHILWIVPVDALEVEQALLAGSGEKKSKVVPSRTELKFMSNLTAVGASRERRGPEVNYNRGTNHDIL